MTGSALLAVGVLVVAGIAVALQAPVNAALGRTLGASIPAGAVSFGVGCIVLTVLTFAMGQGGALLALERAPAWQFLGGALGVLYVWGSIWSVGSLGVVSMLAAVILGQMLGALALDATGAFGLAVRELSPTRLLAVVLVGAGLVLSRL